MSGTMATGHQKVQNLPKQIAISNQIVNWRLKNMPNNTVWQAQICYLRMRNLWMF